MPLFDKLRHELDRAGRSAQKALDEGRLRLELYRARSSADKFAQRLGYAVYRARQNGADLAPEEYLAHVNNLTAAEAEIARLESLVADAARQRKNPPDSASAPPPAS
jgi:hypothetical protein